MDRNKFNSNYKGFNMSLNARNVPRTGGGNKGPDQEPLDAGSYDARIVEIVDRGVQKQRPYLGEEKPPVQELRVTYELSDEFMVDEEGNELEDKPRWVSETFPFHNLEVDLATSTKRYRALDAEEEHEGDWTKMIGMPCSVFITKKPGQGKNEGKVFNNVSGVAAMRSKNAAKCPELVNPSKVFLLDEPDMEVFNKFPTWLQGEIKSNLNYDGSNLQEACSGAAPAENKEEW